MAELLARGYQAFWADRGNTAFDVSVVAGNRHSLIRVKTSASTHLQWSTKRDGTIFPQMRKSGDYVAIVTVKNGSIRDADIYLVPTHIVDREIRKCQAHWVAQAPTAAERARRETFRHRGMILSGIPTAKNIGRGYAEKWRRYLEAWHQLDGGK
ncbi:MAG: hypothetical protein R3D05_16400 [Dongiaceae bacterium]